MRLRLVLAAVMAAAALPAPAYAQQWLADRRFTEGIGIRVGDLELHPGIGGEFGYDSNYFQRAESEDPIDVFRIRITPHLNLQTLGPQRRAGATTQPMLTFRLSAFAAYNELFDATGDNGDAVSDQRDVALGVSALANIAPQRPLGVDLLGDVQRVTEPSNLPQEEFAWDRWSIRGGGGVTWRPGGGLFDMRVGYDLHYSFFEQGQYDVLDNLQHTINLKGRWRFLPRTALLYEGGYTFIRYINENEDSGDDGVNDGEVVRSRIGISGLVTYRLALSGSIGWVSSFYDNVPENADTIIGQAEAKYYIMAPPSADAPSASTGLSTVALGYNREMTNSYLNTFYERDRVYASLSYMLGGAFVTSLEGGWSYLQFPEGEQFDAFTQHRIDARLFAEYRLTDTLGLNGTVRYDVATGSEDLDIRGAATCSTDVMSRNFCEDLDFTRWQAYIGLRWFM